MTHTALFRDIFVCYRSVLCVLDSDIKCILFYHELQIKHLKCTDCRMLWRQYSFVFNMLLAFDFKNSVSLL